MVAEFVCLCGGVVVVVVFAFGVFAFDFDGGYGITDCGVKGGGGGEVSSRTRSICRFGSSND